MNTKHDNRQKIYLTQSFQRDVPSSLVPFREGSSSTSDTAVLGEGTLLSGSDTLGYNSRFMITEKLMVWTNYVIR